ncbi:MAG TPA: DNA internalization-related competence protein ComEC/Rec2, partial [Pyrinomonadaceae bacterium]|nr:DNA internalization-related competence protein ComEC/Rec2 [Pyrinomonadaceae bacterium]
AVVVALWKNRLALSGGALLAAMFFVGAVLGTKQPQLPEMPAGGTLVITGVLDGPPEYARDRVYLSLKVEHGFKGSVFLFAQREQLVSDLRYGTRIRVTVRLMRTDNYRNPGVSPLSEYLERKGYVATGVIKGSIENLGESTAFPPLAWLYDWRGRLQREIDSRFTPDTAGVLDAALLGNRYNLTRLTAERFREGGTFHVLVISGLHISFIGGIVLLATRRLTKRRLLQFLLPAGFVWCYSVAVGAEASVMRAALMFTFAGLGAVLFRPATSLNALGGATLVLLVQSPKEIFDPSFQLTFLSVLAIIVIAWPLLRKFAAIGAWYPTGETPYPPNCSRGLKAFCEALFWSEKRWKREMAQSSHHYRLFKVPFAAALERYKIQWCLRYVFGAMVVSAAVQIMLLPQMIVHFHRLSLASLVLNIVVSVLLAVLAAVALLAVLIAQVSTTIAAPVLQLAEWINWLMVHSVEPFSDAGLVSLRLPEYLGWVRLIYVAYYAPLLLLVVALHRWEPLSRFGNTDRSVLVLALIQLTLIAIVIAHPLSAARTSGQLRVDFLDVGQGDSALITMPDGTTLLVDGGGRPRFRSEATFERESRSIGESVVSEYLWWRGLDRVDYVLATHADADHIDGLNDVVRNFTVNTALVGRTPANDPEFAKFSQSLTNTYLQTVRSGDVIRFGEVELHVLWPQAVGTDSSNDDSVVLNLKFRERSILLTGDIEKKAEAALVAPELRADVVKVPHHGSKTSSTAAFVSATNPRFAIISVGRDSMFGHPHAEVVERWKHGGAEVLTTGKCGTITVITDGTGLSVRGFVPTCERQK